MYASVRTQLALVFLSILLLKVATTGTSLWSPWSACSQYCGGGRRYRTRKCPGNGNCVEPTLDTSSCNKQKCIVSCREYYLIGDRRDGLHLIYPDGPCVKPVNTICDQKGGGWTLLMQVLSNQGWNETTVLNRNADGLIYSQDFSILGKADAIKFDDQDEFPFQYRLEASDAKRWGGVWQAPHQYSFVSRHNNQSDVRLIWRFDEWTAGRFGIGKRMPWLPLDDETLLTTNDRQDKGDRWGTVVSRPRSYRPSPWIYADMENPGKIWYWLKEFKKSYTRPDDKCVSQLPLPVHGGYEDWSPWSGCSEHCNGGYQKRERFCTNPRPAGGGVDCERLGVSEETRACNTFACAFMAIRNPGGLCVRPESPSCSLSDFTRLVFDTDCAGVSTWFLMMSDGSIQHACSRKCIRPLNASEHPRDGTTLALSDDACHKTSYRFQKTNGMTPFGRGVQHIPSGKCLQSVSGGSPKKGDIVGLRTGCATGWDTLKRVFTFPNPDCSAGMETGEIKRSQITASSALGPQYAPELGRLRNPTSGWCPHRLDMNPYLEIDLGWVDNIEGIATQGLQSNPWFVRKFTVSYSTDGNDWQTYKESGLDKVFTGNSNPVLVKVNRLEPAVRARRIRIQPLQWHENACLRVEVYRCPLSHDTFGL